jgi:sarcosine oxidase, subunit delta
LKLVPCPLNGLRPAEEFICAGEVRAMPDPAMTSDIAWAHHVFNRNGSAGIKREWWCHVPSGYWFIAERDTATDEIRATFEAAAALPAP